MAMPMGHHGGMTHMAGGHPSMGDNSGVAAPPGNYGQQQPPMNPAGGHPGGVNPQTTMPPHPPPQQPQQPQQQAPQKELNAAMLCRYGQETVQEIAMRSQEFFQLMKVAQPPDGKTNLGMDRKAKFHEFIKTIKANFNRLRVIYKKVEETFPSNREINFEEDIINKSSDLNVPFDDKRNTESYKQAVEEYKEVMENARIKNLQLKDAIDHLRTVIWDVNTMLAMRKE